MPVSISAVGLMQDSELALLMGCSFIFLFIFPFQGRGIDGSLLSFTRAAVGFNLGECSGMHVCSLSTVGEIQGQTRNL